MQNLKSLIEKTEKDYPHLISKYKQPKSINTTNLYHDVIISNFQIDLFIKMMKNVNLNDYKKNEKEEIAILIEMLSEVKADQNRDTLHSLVI